ncbi:hypothetical protein RHSP_59959 [Rhizobium freirei PRF 81]|uniref:Uncharacterized protein n=1 Tax=Rhizobium freirei PRF 81 TaxID=363754 RepID=N6UH87_9HYPH|nr:hypothetical protein RHSP_59959 [Rhizobium freirei PRF 81]
MNRLARDDARSLDVDARTAGRVDRALAVDRVAESVDNAAEQFRTNRNVNDGARTLDGVAFLDVAVGAEDNHTDVVGFEVQSHTADAAGEFDHFAGLDVVQTVDAGDTVTDGENLADFGDFSFLAEVFDLIFQNCGNFRGADIHQPTSFNASLRVESLVRRDVSIWREPTLTIRPPRIEGSTVTAIATSLPVTPFSAAFNSSSCAGVSAWAEVTSAEISPRCLAAMMRKALIMPGSAKRRRLLATSFRKLVT